MITDIEFDDNAWPCVDCPHLRPNKTAARFTMECPIYTQRTVAYNTLKDMKGIGEYSWTIAGNKRGLLACPHLPQRRGAILREQVEAEEAEQDRWREEREPQPPPAFTGRPTGQYVLDRVEGDRLYVRQWVSII